MQFIELNTQYQALKVGINKRIQTVLDHGQYIMGPEVQELEKRLSIYTNVKHVITCANGTDALQLALMVIGVKPGQLVFVPSFTFFATAEVVALMGARPVFVDIDPRTFNIDPEKLEQAILREQQKSIEFAAAVIAVDLFGLPSNYETLEGICKKYNLKLIEDAAQSFGGAIGQRKAGAFGDIATTSFFPAKPLGCYGDGGALFTNNDEYAETLRSLRFHGRGANKYDNIHIGMNSRLDTIQAAILLEKLDAFPCEAIAREKNAAFYTERLQANYTTPFTPSNFSSAWAQYSIIAKDSIARQEIQKACAMNKIPTMVYYPRPLHLMKAFKHLGHIAGDFPISEDIADRIFSIPMHPYLTDNSARAIIQPLLEHR